MITGRRPGRPKYPSRTSVEEGLEENLPFLEKLWDQELKKLGRVRKVNDGADFRVTQEPTDRTKTHSVEFCRTYGLHTAFPEFFCFVVKYPRNRSVLNAVYISITDFFHVPRMHDKRKYTYK